MTDLNPKIQRALAQAKNLEPATSAQAATWTAIESSVAAGATPEWGAAKSAAAWKVGGALALVLAAGAAVAVPWSGGPAEEGAVEASIPAPSAAVDRSAAGLADRASAVDADASGTEAPAEAAPAPERPVASDVPEPAPAVERPSAPTRKDARAPRPELALADATDLLAKTYASLKAGNPKRALQLVRKYERTRHDPALNDAFSAARAMAQCRLAPGTPAAARAVRAFERKHSSSPYAARVRSACDEQ